MQNKVEYEFISNTDTEHNLIWKKKTEQNNNEYAG